MSSHVLLWQKSFFPDIIKWHASLYLAPEGRIYQIIYLFLYTVIDVQLTQRKYIWHWLIIVIFITTLWLPLVTQLWGSHPSLFLVSRSQTSVCCQAPQCWSLCRSVTLGRRNPASPSLHNDCRISKGLWAETMDRHHMMMSWHRKIFYVTGPLWGKPLITDRNPSQKFSNTELWYLHCWQPEHAV